VEVRHGTGVLPARRGINLVQIEVVRRLRAGDNDPRLHDAFVVTVNGIAAGMRNTG
jgi:phosphoenolpyruvate carboxylase